MLSLAGYLGFRIGEFLALKAGDYDPATGKASITHQIIEGTGEGRCIDTGTLKTRASYREKRLTPGLAALLEDYIEKTRKKPTDYLFNGVGDPLHERARPPAHHVRVARRPVTDRDGRRRGRQDCREQPDRLPQHLRLARQGEDEDKLIDGVDEEFEKTCEYAGKKNHV